MNVVPPAGVSPARLFRILLQRPRAVAPLARRITGAEHVALRVRAISSLDEAAIADAAENAGPNAGSRAAAELLVRALLTDHGPAFASSADVGALMDFEAMSLAREVRSVLDVISPTYARSDVGAWAATLKKGAYAGVNWAETLAIGGCVDYAFGFGVGRFTERPDRYFGMPLAEMTDGQWMAYRAALDIVEGLKKKK
ncbi:hypothetical protein WMF38_57465 [Sorangium sp. So ce118]